MKKVGICILVVLMAIGSMAFAQGTSETGTQPKKVAQVEYLCLKNEIVPVMTTLTDKFNKENVDVQVQLVSSPEAATVLKTRIAANDLPDVFNSYPAEMLYKGYANDGLLMNLTGQAFLNNISPSFVDLIKQDGKVYALPVTMSVYGIYYRKDLFAKYGLTAPKTYDELIADCKVLKQNGIIPIAFSDKTMWTVGQIMERLMGVVNPQMDTEFRKVASGELDIHKAPGLNTFIKMMLELHQYSYQDTLSMEYETCLADVVQGKAAMIIAGSWALSSMETNNPDIDKNIELIPFPSPSGDTLVPVNVDTSYSISATTKNKDAALKFLDFLSKTENEQIYVDQEKTPNMTKGVTYNVGPHKLMSDYLQSGKIFLTLVNVWPSGLREEMRTVTQQLYMDRDTEKYLQAVNKAIGKYYKNK